MITRFLIPEITYDGLLPSDFTLYISAFWNDFQFDFCCCLQRSPCHFWRGCYSYLCLMIKAVDFFRCQIRTSRDVRNMIKKHSCLDWAQRLLTKNEWLFPFSRARTWSGLQSSEESFWAQSSDSGCRVRKTIGQAGSELRRYAIGRRLTRQGFQIFCRIIYNFYKRIKNWTNHH